MSESNSDWVEWRIYCETEQAWKLWKLDSAEPAPTTCPTDTAHTCNADSVDRTPRRRVVREVIVKEEDVRTGGHFDTHGVVINADCNAVTLHNEAAFVAESVLAISYTTTDMHKGDIIDVTLAKETPIGVVTAPVAVDDTVFRVSATVFDHAYKGPCLASISDGTHRAQLGRIKALDRNALTVTTERGSPHSFVAGPTTLFEMTVSNVRSIEIGPPSHEIVGSSKIGASHVPQDIVVQLTYHNRSMPWPIGRLTSDAGSGTNVLSVDAGVLEQVELGDKLQLADKQQAVAPIGSVTQIDKLNETVTVDGIVPSDFLAATPTLVVKASKKFVARVEQLQ